MMRIAGLVAGVFLLCAASLPPEPPPLPGSLKPYVKDGRLVPGDYGWTRGMFKNAAPQDEAVFLELTKWQDKCLEDGRSQVRTKLADMGFPEPQLDRSAGGALLCQMVGARPYALRALTFDQFEQVRDRALPLAETYLTAEKIASEWPKGPDLADALVAHPLGEQMIRRAFTWGTGDMAGVPKLTSEEAALFQARLTMQMAVRDHENTEWLKGIVAKTGWPTKSKVGDLASMQAWLLVQHADHDPVFQLEVLRLMEPLVPKGEVSKPNYAYLYDRIMLKLNGKQRYATQMTCEKGSRVPMPLEDEAAVGKLRAAMGLNTLADYISSMNGRAGACPSP